MSPREIRWALITDSREDYSKTKRIKKKSENHDNFLPRKNKSCSWDIERATYL